MTIYTLPIGDVIRTSTGKDGNKDDDWLDDEATPIG